MIKAYKMLNRWALLLMDLLFILSVLFAVTVLILENINNFCEDCGSITVLIFIIILKTDDIYFKCFRNFVVFQITEAAQSMGLGKYNENQTEIPESIDSPLWWSVQCHYAVLSAGVPFSRDATNKKPSNDETQRNRNHAHHCLKSTTQFLIRPCCQNLSHFSVKIITFGSTHCTNVNSPLHSNDALNLLS